MLRNESVSVADLQFLGLDDYWGPYFHPEALLAQKGSDPSTIVLCHNPAADSPMWANFPSGFSQDTPMGASASLLSFLRRFCL